MTDEVPLARDVTAEGEKKHLRAVRGRGRALGNRGDVELREVVAHKLTTPKGYRASNQR